MADQQKQHSQLNSTPQKNEEFKKPPVPPKKKLFVCCASQQNKLQDKDKPIAVETPQQKSIFEAINTDTDKQRRPEPRKLSHIKSNSLMMSNAQQESQASISNNLEIDPKYNSLTKSEKVKDDKQNGRISIRSNNIKFQNEDARKIKNSPSDDGFLQVDEIACDLDEDVDNEHYSDRNINNSQFVNKLRDFSSFNPSGNKGKEKFNYTSSTLMAQNNADIKRKAKRASLNGTDQNIVGNQNAQLLLIGKDQAIHGYNSTRNNQTSKFNNQDFQFSHGNSPEQQHPEIFEQNMISPEAQVIDDKNIYLKVNEKSHRKTFSVQSNQGAKKLQLSPHQLIKDSTAMSSAPKYQTNQLQINLINKLEQIYVSQASHRSISSSQTNQANKQPFSNTPSQQLNQSILASKQLEESKFLSVKDDKIKDVNNGSQRNNSPPVQRIQADSQDSQSNFYSANRSTHSEKAGQSTATASHLSFIFKKLENNDQHNANSKYTYDCGYRSSNILLFLMICHQSIQIQFFMTLLQEKEEAMKQQKQKLKQLRHKVKQSTYKYTKVNMRLKHICQDNMDIMNFMNVMMTSKLLQANNFKE
ncbi:UNKNOWN [Stylonychia lemnae]|uniref:Uncharacterized protein n=1 Tax=Stylonychia lemnae TaxID=5949 RepID=A0A078AQU6_STYLE|nr:UNKNOWN [Stylonychia lemnae]|eukprot:CDW84589.1 UNKNOWN [Stylonychia lemnae]